jgi:hypothetical protein
MHQVCLHMHAPHDSHWALVMRILRYTHGTTSHGIHLISSTNTVIKAYSDVDWAGFPDTRRSISCYCVFLGDSLVSWSSKRQTMVSRYSTEAEY